MAQSGKHAWEGGEVAALWGVDLTFAKRAQMPDLWLLPTSTGQPCSKGLTSQGQVREEKEVQQQMPLADQAGLLQGGFIEGNHLDLYFPCKCKQAPEWEACLPQTQKGPMFLLVILPRPSVATAAANATFALKVGSYFNVKRGKFPVCNQFISLSSFWKSHLSSGTNNHCHL